MTLNDKLQERLDALAETQFRALSCGIKRIRWDNSNPLYWTWWDIRTPQERVGWTSEVREMIGISLPLLRDRIVQTLYWASILAPGISCRSVSFNWWDWDLATNQISYQNSGRVLKNSVQRIYRHDPAVMCVNTGRAAPLDVAPPAGAGATSSGLSAA